MRLIKYSTDDMKGLEEVIERADTCRQYIEYQCNNSKLLAPVGKLWNYFHFCIKSRSAL